MSSNNSADILSRQIMLFVMDMIDEGNRKHLEEMGFKPEHISKLIELRTREIGHLSSRRANMFDIKVNDSVLNICLQDIEGQRLIDDCILAGAPNDFLYGFFGLNSRECSIRRISLEVEAKNDKRVPDSDKEAEIIINHYLSALGERSDEDFDAQDYLNLYQTISKSYKRISLKVIWRAVHRYQREAWIPSSNQHNKTGAMA
ncbi:MAG: DUF2857 family protein [Methyloprofundus sp.]|uniref:STY4526/YPO1902 family pathogenicity island replication protein n=1 Tax=Thiomicrospira sp. TaxID=935 RepID=UPI001A06F80F|nr:DUF2857 family protein [Methyloprofundus sp.]